MNELRTPLYDASSKKEIDRPILSVPVTQATLPSISMDRPKPMLFDMPHSDVHRTPMNLDRVKDIFESKSANL